MQINEKDYISINEFAKFHQVSRQSIYFAIREGRIPVTKIFGRLYVKQSELKKYSPINYPKYEKDSREDSINSILIVDDNDDFLEFMRICTEKIYVGAQIRTALNGFTAGLLLNQFKPDLLFLDIMMPGMEGSEICRQIKTSASTRDCKVIVVTCLTDPKKHEELLREGALAVWDKSFTLETLRKRLEDLNLYPAVPSVAHSQSSLVMGKA